MIKTLTRLPVDLAVTHCHGDHMYHLDQFDRYYMSEKDVFLLNGPRMKQAYGGKDYSHAQLMPVQDGDIIDLGGGYQVEVFDWAGIPLAASSIWTKAEDRIMRRRARCLDAGNRCGPALRSINIIWSIFSNG